MLNLGQTIQHKEIMTTENLPALVGNYTGKVSGQFMSWPDSVTCKRLAAIAFGAGNVGLCFQGFFSNPLEIAAASILFSNTIALMIWPNKEWAIKYLGATVVIAGGLLFCSSINKSSPLLQITFAGLSSVRGIVLLLNDTKDTAPAIVKFLKRYQKEIFAGTAAPSRLFLLASGIINREPGIIAAALEWLIADGLMFASGRAEKRQKALDAARMQRDGR